MIFEYTLGLKEEEIDRSLKVINRNAVRAVIKKENKILMIKTNKGDYKFPGGGVEKNESFEEGIIREVREEAGCIVSKIVSKLGEITERNIDRYGENALFQMYSHYYLCEITEERVEQNLDEYEVDLDFKSVWIDLDETINLNEKLLNDENRNPWVDREYLALKAIKNKF